MTSVNEIRGEIAYHTSMSNRRSADSRLVDNRLPFKTSHWFSEDAPDPKASRAFSSEESAKTEATREEREGWSKEKPRKPDRNLYCDIAIVGAGFAGLSAALEIKCRNPKLDVSIFEAQHAGFGASGRNAGWLMGLPPLLWLLEDTENEKRWEEIRFVSRNIESNLRELKTFLKEQGYSPDQIWQPSRHHLVARNALEEATIRWAAPRFAKAGYPTEQISAARTGDIVSYPARSAIAYEIDTIHPFHLVRSLKAICERNAINIYEDAAIQSVKSGHTQVELKTSAGYMVRAAKLILATNAYTDRIERNFPIPEAKPKHTYMLATNPLDDATLDRISRSRAPFGDPALSFYIGRLHGRSLLFNGVDRDSAVREEDDRHVRSFMKLERALFKRFPFLDSTSIGSAWAGAYLQTGTEAPIVGTVPGHPNVILSIGYGGGSGVGTALMSGKLTADLATEDRMDSDAERMRTLFASGMRWPIGGFLRAGLSILKGMISGSI
ncbi:MAG: hypothetical protein CMN76_20185 [Spirochaetaceae bacterium]|nr:hypothetical protein [Spirochaetaceae bacterium]